MTIDGRKDPEKRIISFNITGSKVKNININTDRLWLEVEIEKAISDGELSISLERRIIDSKDGNNTDSQFQVFVGGKRVDSSSLSETYNTAELRKLSIPFDNGYENIRIVGSEVLANGTQDGIAEFFEIYRIQISLVVAMAAVAFILIIIIRILRENTTDKFFDIILDEDWYPSLPKFQIFIWTVVILFAFLWVYLSRISGGTLGIADFPYNLMILMGVSSTTYAINKKVSDMKYGNPSVPSPRPAKPHPYRSMLYEGNRKSLTRIQYFAWTWIGIVVYLLLLTLEIVHATDFSKLDVSDIPAILVIMMGIGQGAYIGGKFWSIKDLFKTKDEDEDEDEDEQKTISASPTREP